MVVHGHSFLKSIILSRKLDTFLKYLVLKLEKLKQKTKKQSVTKYIGTTNFCKSFPLLFFEQCCWVCKLHGDHTASKLLTHNIDIGVSLLIENLNKLSFTEFVTGCSIIIASN